MWKLSPNRTSRRFSQIAFPIIVLPKDDRTDFAQEEQLGLPYWTHLYHGKRIQMSGHSDLGIFNNFGASPFLLGYKQILRLPLVHRNLAIWRWYPWSWRLSFEMLMILVRWILHKTLNRLFQYHLGVQLDLCTFGALPPIQHFSDDRCPLMKKNELLRPTSLLHRSPVSYFWLWSSSTPKFSPIFPIPCPLLLLLLEFS